MCFLWKPLVLYHGGKGLSIGLENKPSLYFCLGI